MSKQYSHPINDTRDKHGLRPLTYNEIHGQNKASDVKYEYFYISSLVYRLEPTLEKEWEQSQLKIERMFNERYGNVDVCWYDIDNDVFKAKRSIK